MIVLRDKPGQLGNRLWSLSPFLVLCEKKNITLLAPYHLNGYFDFFEKENIKGIMFLWPEFPFLQNILYRIFRLSELSLRKVNKYGLSIRSVWANPKKHNFDDLFEMAKKNIVFVNSWDYVFNVPDNILLHERSLIQLRLKPNHKTCSNVNKLMSKFTQNKIKVGVHIRLSDYKSYRNGIYYYDISVYYSKMKIIEAQLKADNKNAIFIICSDENIQDSFFEGLETLYIQNSTAIEDIYALSVCDFIIGAPSSFSCWASYFGHIPIKYILSQNDSIDINEFSAATGLHRFQNGKIFIPGST